MTLLRALVGICQVYDLAHLYSGHRLDALRVAWRVALTRRFWREARRG